MTHEEAVAIIAAHARVVLGKLPAAQWRSTAMAASAELMKLSNMPKRESGGWKVEEPEEKPDTVRPPHRSSAPTLPEINEKDKA